MADVFTVHDDGVSPKETLPVVITKTVEHNEQYSLNDLTTEIESIDNQLDDLNNRKVALLTIKTNIQSELDKLPPRPANEDDV